MYYTKKQLILFFMLFMSVVFSSIAIADKLYVAKNLKVHTQASLESPVNHLLLGGEEVEVLRIDGDFTEIQDEGDHIGWVASEFLSSINPIGKEKKSPPQSSSIKTQTKILQQQLHSKQIKVKKIVSPSKANPPTQISKKHSSQSSSSKNKFAEIEQSKQQLQLKLDKIRDILEIEGTNNSSQINNYYSYKHQYPYFELWLIGGGIIVGFIFGILWHDFYQRRRHGGYKV